MNDHEVRYQQAKALFLGPKAENAEMIEKLLVECLRDHCFWRRNFHPEDVELVSEADGLHAPFLESSADLRHHLNQLMAMLKRGSPNFHPRYLGHMHTDLLSAGILGQFASIFYTQNNVTPEASPVTSRLEMDVLRQIAAMVGYATTGATPYRGHLCSGGTVANIEAVWAARNIRHTPISLALAIRQAPRAPGGMSAARKQLLEGLTVFEGSQQRTVLSLSTLELLNLPIRTILDWHDKIALALDAVENPSSSRSKPGAKTSETVQGWLRHWGPEHLGIARVNELLYEAGLRPLSDYPWQLYVSTTKHYSFEKIADVLGLGRQSLIQIDINNDFSLNVEQLETVLKNNVLAAMKQNQPCPLPLAVIAVMGSTEEGALDDLPALTRMRERFRQKGLEMWLHSDAAYGGYAVSMLRAREPGQKAQSASKFFSGLLGEQGDLGSDPLIRDTWTTSFERLRGMAETDSVTVDPHKLGYLPYPAGVILFQDDRTKMALGCDVPYLFDREEEQVFPGRYTLEGSRPGHVAAGVYLAHQVLPLDQEGHGMLVGRSLLGTRDIYVNTRNSINGGVGLTSLDPDHSVRLRFLCPPSLNILNYVIGHKEVTTLADQNRLTELILQEMSAGDDLKRTISDFEFFAVRTSLNLKKYDNVLRPWMAEAGLSCTAEEQATGGLAIFRSVIMHHHFLGARTRVTSDNKVAIIPLWEALAQFFIRICKEKVKVLQEENLIRRFANFPRRARIMIAEDEREQSKAIIDVLLKAQRDFQFEPVPVESKDAALKWFETHRDLKVDLLIADLRLEGDADLSADRGSGFAVIERYREAMGPTAPVLILSSFQGMVESERQPFANFAYLDKSELLALDGIPRFLDIVASLFKRINKS